MGKSLVSCFFLRHSVHVWYTQGDSDVISMLAGFRCHLVDKTLINVFHCSIAEIRFVGKLVMLQTFSCTNDFSVQQPGRHWVQVGYCACRLQRAGLSTAIGAGRACVWERALGVMVASTVRTPATNCRSTASASQVSSLPASLLLATSCLLEAVLIPTVQGVRRPAERCTDNIT